MLLASSAHALHWLFLVVSSPTKNMKNDFMATESLILLWRKLTLNLASATYVASVILHNALDALATIPASFEFPSPCPTCNQRCNLVLDISTYLHHNLYPCFKEGLHLHQEPSISDVCKMFMIWTPSPCLCHTHTTYLSSFCLLVFSHCLRGMA